MKRGPAVKKLLREEFNVKAKSVTIGRGTGRGWLTIILSEDYHFDKIQARWKFEEKMEKRIVDLGLCGTYWPDTGPGANPRTPCIHWEYE